MTVVINGSTGIDTVQDGVVTDSKLNLTANSAEIKEALNAGGSAPIYACRAWVNFNGTGTVAIRASGNVSSITDVGTGVYRVNMTTAMPDANYSAYVSAGAGTTATVFVDQGPFRETPTTTTFSFMSITSALAAYDAAYVSVAVFR